MFPWNSSSFYLNSCSQVCQWTTGCPEISQLNRELRFQPLSVASERAFSSLFQEHNFEYFKILGNRNKLPWVWITNSMFLLFTQSFCICTEFSHMVLTLKWNAFHLTHDRWNNSLAYLAYLKLLLFLPGILIPACASSSPAFLVMYSAYKLNKHSDNIQPWRTPFPVWKQSVVPCPVNS